MRFPELYKQADRKIYLRKIRHSVRAADQIIAISEQSKNDLVDFFKLKPEKVEVVYQSINPIFFEKVSLEELNAVRKKFSLPTEFMLTVGTIEARKNLKNILKAMEHTNVQLPIVVVGKKTKYLNTIEPLMHQFEDQIILLHEVNDFDLSRIYQLATMMIYPSVFEGFGLPVAEAQACGCPVITSNISSMPEAGGDAAHYVQPQNYIKIGQAIDQLLQDEDYRKKLIKKGKSNAQRFTPETYAYQLMNIYKRLYHAE
jgi:glycosyltransferase involved in cell wall biosynthesis